MAEGQRAQAVRALNYLLDTVLNDGHAFSAEFIFATLQDVLPRDVDFEIVLRERRRFFKEKRDLERPYLNFAFLSFGWTAGELHRFKDLKMEEFDARIAALESSSDRDTIEKQKVVCFVPTGADKETRELIELAGRCMAAFYHTCGAYEHFITNVTKRFVKDYFLEHKRFDVADIVQAVERICDVRAAYFTAVSGTEVVAVPEADPTGIYAELEGDAQFQDDLKESLSRKVAINGMTACGYNYVIHTLAHEYFDHARPMIETGGTERKVSEGSFAYAPRAVVVTAAKDRHLTLDVLSFAPRIFRAYLSDRIFSAREELFYRLLRDGGRLADRLLVEPAGTDAELRGFLYPLLEQACDVLVELTFARSVAIRAYDPFEESLLVVASSQLRDVSAPCPVPSVPVSQGESFASARVYRAQESEGLEPPDNGTPVAAKDFGEADGHIASIPIKIGAIVLGTLDFFAADRKFFAHDRQYLEVAAGAVGELIRRIEAANDAAWLSRLSFLHSARHQLERFKRTIAQSDDKLAGELGNIIELYSTLENSLKEQKAEQFVANVRSLLELHGIADDQTDAFVERVEAIFTERVPALSRLLFQEMLETLLHNAREHNHVRLDDIGFSVLGAPDAAPSTLMVRYLATGSRRGAAVLSRLCVAPIYEGATYHYGLFLLATQLRMAGGFASGRRLDKDVVTPAPFEVVFGIPLTDSFGD